MNLKSLIFVCKTDKDFRKFKEVIDKSDYYAEENNHERFFEFPEDNPDALEKELQKLIDKNDINGHFELG